MVMNMDARLSLPTSHLLHGPPFDGTDLGAFWSSTATIELPEVAFSSEFEYDGFDGFCGMSPPLHQDLLPRPRL